VIAPQKSLKTNLAYVQHIIAGLREHGIDATYLARVQEIAIANNPDIAEDGYLHRIHVRDIRLGVEMAEIPSRPVSSLGSWASK
jgi:hypothetical protein